MSAFRQPYMAPRGTGARRTGASGMVGGGYPVNGAGPSSDFRPVTQSGLLASAGGNNRTAATVGSELRSRISDISQEIKSLQVEGNTFNREQEQFTSFERKKEILNTNVNELQNQLASYNQALDNMRSGMNMQEFENQIVELEQRNKAEKGWVDEVFMRRTGADQRTHDIESAIASLKQQVEHAMSSLGSEHREEYYTLNVEKQRFANEIRAKEIAIHELDQKIRNAQATLQKDEFKVHYKGMKLKKSIEEAQARYQQLENEISEQLTPEQTRAKLMERVKLDKIAAEKAEDQVKKIEDDMEALRAKMIAKETELNNFDRYAESSKKYQALQERDQKMQEFLDKYEETFTDENANKTKLQNTIVALLRHMSKTINMGTALPSQEKFTELKDDLSFKQKHYDNTQKTLNQMKAEREKRQAELDKLNNLDERITEELQSLKSQLLSMKKEMNIFDNIDELKIQHEEEKTRLINDTADAKDQTDVLTMQINARSATLEEQQQMLNTNDTFKKMESLEQKVRTLQQAAFQLNSYILDHQRQSDFERPRETVKAITEKINALLQLAKI